MKRSLHKSYMTSPPLRPAGPHIPHTRGSLREASNSTSSSSLVYTSQLLPEYITHDWGICSLLTGRSHIQSLHTVYKRHSCPSNSLITTNIHFLPPIYPVYNPPISLSQHDRNPPPSLRRPTPTSPLLRHPLSHRSSPPHHRPLPRLQDLHPLLRLPRPQHRRPRPSHPRPRTGQDRRNPHRHAKPHALVRSTRSRPRRPSRGSRSPNHPRRGESNRCREGGCAGNIPSPSRFLLP